MTVLIVLISNHDFWSRFLPNEFVEVFVVVDGFVRDFTLGFLSCGVRNRFV